jgi:hypothetical protein
MKARRLRKEPRDHAMVAGSHHVEQDPDPHFFEAKSWIRIRIKVKSWIRIRIRIKVMQPLTLHFTKEKYILENI